MKKIALLLTIIYIITSCSDSNEYYKCNNQLSETHWRNELTGDWDIGFYEDYAVYDCKFWKYKKISENDDKFEITIENNNDTLTIIVDQEIENKRNITIGKNLLQQYSQITTSFLPNYPTKDDTSKIVDNNYQINDSATIICWFKGKPSNILSALFTGCVSLWYRTIGDEFNIYYPDFEYNSILDPEEYNTRLKLDENNCITLKIPTYNTTSVWFHNKEFVVEPNETYLYLVDYDNNQILVMGKNARLQNEMFANETYYFMPEMMITNDDDLKKYIEESEKQKNFIINSVLNNNPTISARYINYRTQEIETERTFAISNYRFYKPFWTFSDSLITTFLDKKAKPYTAFNGIFDRYNTYLDMCQTKFPSFLSNSDFRDIFYYAEAKGEISFTNEEKKCIESWVEMQNKYINTTHNIFDGKKPIISNTDSIDKIYADTLKVINQILGICNNNKFISNLMLNKTQIIEYDNFISMLDSLNCDTELSDFCLAKKMLRNIYERQIPLNDSIIERIKQRQESHQSAILDIILQKNDSYIARINNAKLDSTSIHQNNDFNNLTDGETIFNKIIEPYKNKLILINFWDTWYTPCKVNLSHSKELDEAVSDCDIVFIYLCSKSSNDAWLNVIKSYNLSGKNKIHYNLPFQQEKAIENYLNINSFPTYILIDKNGTMHDIEWHYNNTISDVAKMIKSYK